MNKLKKPGIGFIFLVVSFIGTLISLILFISTYNVFKYELNRWAFSCLVLSLWGLLFLIVNNLIKGEHPFWQNIIYPIIAFLLVFSFTEFINPCLSPIGIYFTVHNMGDTATNDIGVPRSLITCGFYLISIISILVASFTKASKEETK